MSESRCGTGPNDEPTGPDGRWWTPGVAGIAAASLFSDTGHEATTAVLPAFLTSTLGASAGALGIVEGCSDALIGVTKLIGGPLADHPGNRRRAATGGYLGTALATGAIGLAATVWQAGMLRALAWISRGLRGPARDSLLASLAPKAGYGRAFGLERAGDNLGAVAGPLLAAAGVAWAGIRPTLLLAAIPGLFAAASVYLAAREARRRPVSATRRARRRYDFAALRERGMARALIPVALFEFGNLANTLLILRATGLLTVGDRTGSAAASLAILIYAAHNAVAALAALAAGYWLDRTGPRIVFGCGAVAYVLGYAVFAAGPHAIGWLCAGFALVGAGIGLAEPAQSAVVAHLLPDELRGSGFGLLGAVQAAGDLIATVTAGLLYTLAAPAVAFGYAATWMALSVAACGGLRPRGRRV